MNQRAVLRFAVLAVLVLWLTPGPAWSQGTATLNGVVTSSNDDPVPGARVVLTNKQTKETKETQTDSKGRYELGGLIAGDYDVRIEAAGHPAREHKNVHLTAGQTTTLNSKLGGGGAGRARRALGGTLPANMFGAEYSFIHVTETGVTPGSTETLDLHGFDVTYVRWISRCIGLQGNFVGGWGSDTPVSGVDTRLMFGSGGIRFAAGRDKPFTPWVQVAFGGGQVRFTSNSGPTSTSQSETGFIMVLGGGGNWNIGEHWAIKVFEVNYAPSHFFQEWQKKNVQVKSGFYIKF
jgi:hypothetical protein